MLYLHNIYWPLGDGRSSVYAVRMRRGILSARTSCSTSSSCKKTPPFPAISSSVSRHPAILHINLGGARRTEATSAACSTSTFSKNANPPKRHLCHQPRRPRKRAGTTPRRGQGAPRNAMDDAVMCGIAKVEQTFGAWRLSVVD